MKNLIWELRGYSCILWETQWPNGQCTGLWVGRSAFKTWPGQLCCVLRQNTTLSQYLSPSRSINGYWQIVREAWWNTGELLCDGLASLPQGSSNNPSYFILLGNWDKPQLNGLIGSCTDLTFYIHISLFQHNYHNILTLNSLNCSKSPKSEKGKEVLPCVF